MAIRLVHNTYKFECAAPTVQMGYDVLSFILARPEPAESGMVASFSPDCGDVFCNFVCVVVVGSSSFSILLHLRSVVVVVDRVRCR